MLLHRICSTVLVCCLLSLLHLPASAQDVRAQKFSTRVCVSVFGEDTERVSSYLERELRALGDVIVVGENDATQDWRLNVISVKLVNNAKVHTGYVITYEIQKKIAVTSFLSLLEKSIPNPTVLQKASLDIITSEIADAYRIVDRGFVAGGPDSLKANCEHIITTFDTDYLKAARESWQKTLDRLKAGKV